MEIFYEIRVFHSYGKEFYLFTIFKGKFSFNCFFIDSYTGNLSFCDEFFEFAVLNGLDFTFCIKVTIEKTQNDKKDKKKYRKVNFFVLLFLS